MTVKSNNLLTICIQTFNRAEFLEQLLKTIADEESFHVLVGDFSTDALQASQNKSFCNQRKNTTYFRGVDGGLDYGFNELIKKSNTEYCWMLPDDDIVNEFAITKILEILQRGTCDFLLLNSAIYNETMTTLIKPRVFQIFDQEKPINFENLDKYQHAFSYIGACVFRRTSWLQSNKNTHIGTYFNHVYVISEMFLKDLNFLASPVLATKIRANNALWTQRSFQIWTENWPKALSSLHGKSVTEKERYSVPTVLYYYAYGALRHEHQIEKSRSRYLLFFLSKINRDIVSFIIFVVISIKRLSLVSEPGYYLLKANKNILTRFILRYWYEE